MKFHSLSTLVGGLLALSAALLLTACGGGGATGNPQTAGAIAILPADVTIYAGVPATLQIVGGRRPYALSSSEPNLLPVPAQLDANSFDVLPANPGVVDVGLPPGSLPIRTVIITARGGDGASTSASIKVGQNFLMGYGVSFTASGCPSASPNAPAGGNTACAGGDTAVRFIAVSQGNLHGDQQFRVTLMQGHAVLINPATGANGSSVLVNSDHSGSVTTIIRVAANQPTELGVLRIQDAITGVYVDTVFVIGGNGITTTLTALPNTFTFTGPDNKTCGTGSASFQVFDGTPPYTVVSSIPAIATASPTTSFSQPGVFLVTASNPNVCGTATITVTDSLNARTTVTINTNLGSNPPATPITPLIVSPSTLLLGCGQTASVSVIGGQGATAGSAATYSASTIDPNLTINISGHTVSVARIGTGTGSGGTTTSPVQITDGTSFVTLQVTSPTNCP